jgi:parallel beta-helix repeat protein
MVRGLSDRSQIGPGHIIGQEFKIAVVIENAFYLYAFDIKIYINATYFAYVSHQTTVPWNASQTPVPPSPYAGILYAPFTAVIDRWEADSSVLRLAYSSNSPAYPFDGNGTVCIVTLRLIKQPLDCGYVNVTAIEFLQIRLANFGFWSPPFIYENFMVRVYAPSSVPDMYETIQEAVDNANEGDTILVSNGTYYEGVHINKSLNIIGESPSGTIIDGYVEINANNVQFGGFTVRNGTGGSYGAGLAVYDSSGCVISNNIITLCVHEYGIGIFVLDSDNNTFSENLITQNYGMGIWFYYDSNFNRIVNNTISRNRIGIFITDWGDRCFNNVIMGNDIEYDDTGGIDLFCSVNAKITGNRVRNCSEGISFRRCAYDSSYQCNATVSENWIANCTYGIRLKDAAVSNITSNTVINCIRGISLEGASYNHTVYHNRFINNIQQVNMTGAYTVWDDGYPSGGNYWSDYNGTDADGDGIGDTPYIIDDFNRDNYPLMYPRSFLMGDVNFDCQVDIYDVTAVCIAYDSKPGDPNWYLPADIAPPYGIIDIFDVVRICVHYGEKWPA